MSYFKLGEECILQSANCPELNGECVITVVLRRRLRNFHLGNGETILTNKFAYHTTIKNPNGWGWSELSLRKKHKPSTKSLSTMIEELKKVKV
jgi:hypothetical protein